jgi:hypothetical protein
MEQSQDRVQWQALALAVLNFQVLLPECHLKYCDTNRLTVFGTYTAFSPTRDGEDINCRHFKGRENGTTLHRKTG